ncbi:Uncharacterised protein [uncultured archaeon]|nr:Uncharacterised protein [uncultured archaeon]
MHYMKHDHWAGKPISPISIARGMTVTELVDGVFDGMGYNAKDWLRPVIFSRP